MTRQEYITGIIAKFNQDQNHSDLTPTERVALTRIKDIEQGINKDQERIQTLAKEIDAHNQDIAQIQIGISKERGRVEGVIDMLALGAGVM